MTNQERCSPDAFAHSAVTQNGGILSSSLPVWPNQEVVHLLFPFSPEVLCRGHVHVLAQRTMQIIPPCNTRKATPTNTVCTSVSQDLSHAKRPGPKRTLSRTTGTPMYIPLASSLERLATTPSQIRKHESELDYNPCRQCTPIMSSLRTTPSQRKWVRWVGETSAQPMSSGGRLSQGRSESVARSTFCVLSSAATSTGRSYAMTRSCARGARPNLSRLPGQTRLPQHK